MGGIYVASKAKYASMWREIRARGVPIISTWIDDLCPSDWSAFWVRAVQEASRCAAGILYVSSADAPPKGGCYVETGVILANNSPIFVFVCGDVQEPKFLEHPLITRCSSLEEAIDKAKEVAVLGENGGTP